MSPWFLLCLAFFASFCLVMLNYANWQVKIHGLFVLYVCTALVSFGLGCFVCTKVPKAKETQLPLLYEQKTHKRYPAVAFAVISICMLLLYASKVIADNYAGLSLSTTLRNIYNNTVENDYSPGIIFTQAREVLVAIAYINTYRLITKLFSRKDKIRYSLLLVPIICFFLFVLLSTDRNIFLRYALYFLCLYVFFYRAHYKKKNVNVRIFKRVVVFGICIVAAFFLLGRLKQYNSNFFRAIGIYGGSGLYNFNLWLADFHGPHLYGKATFSTFLRTVQALLGKIGIHVDLTMLSRFDAFITFRNPNGYVYSSNIYSALKPYVWDFGYFGVILFPFVTGLIFQWLYGRAKKSKGGFAWVLYASLIYGVIFYPILEQFFGRFSLGIVYELVWLVVIYHVAFGTQKLRKCAIETERVQGVNHG
ncbi:MAG: oligosaccharide repeat unit polymerase [Clostridiales bacterium]|nr:oligosaccharide repeat unit polymerase [Clostridiales bacterium]